MGIFDVIAVALFWYFGTEIEGLLGKQADGLVPRPGDRRARAAVGRRRRARLRASVVLFSLNQLELMVLLVFIAEYPRRRFFFNIPGWVIGVVIIGISVLGYVGNRDWLLLLNFVLGPGPDRGHRPVAGPDGRADLGARTSAIRRQAEEARSAPAVRRVRAPWSTGPWQPPPTPPVSRDQAALDALLDKISASGMDSLTDAGARAAARPARPAAPALSRHRGCTPRRVPDTRPAARDRGCRWVG